MGISQIAMQIMRAVLATVVACMVAQTAWCFVGPSNRGVLKNAPAGVNNVAVDGHAPEMETGTSTVAAWNPMAFGVALGLLAAVAGGRPSSAFAADLGIGEAICGANCAPCHAGGNNSVLGSP